MFVAQSCLTLCNPMDCSLPGSSVHGIFQAKILAWVAIFLLQEIFPTQGLNPGLPHCRQILYPRSSKGSPSQVALVVKKKQKTKNPPANAGDKRYRFDPWVGKIPWRRARQPPPVFLTGESHGQRNLAGYGTWDCKESDRTDRTKYAQRWPKNRLLCWRSV